ncbi:GNAT family N-acetyltransferase [Hymenobacter persicinus]|uniref:GNAT family N-acetyltransferase n=1 Tax=Hymenobacter persicinus TaxID=2025506 RepID=A0A4Q5LFP0_9BACT|nr:GNAT family N-acetyltransferase [Hymenobacter persicinus]RYU84267.1 GNAT family N-acetyltransferase [Hymenobacter persicinus]
MAGPDAELTIRAIEAADTYPLRHAVLWPDQPLAYVRVPDDEAGVHLGAFHDAELVAVISLFVTGPEARFRKFATRPDWQRRGVGSRLLAATFAAARQLGAQRIWCDARQDAAAFYTRFGLRPEGPVFYKGPVAYQRMRCGL